MTAIPVSKRGTVTLPPEVRRKLGLESVPHPMLLVELREDGVFLHPATAVRVRDTEVGERQQDDARDEEQTSVEHGQTQPDGAPRQVQTPRQRGLSAAPAHDDPQIR